MEDVNPGALDEDFTSHIEPDWDNDVQACNIVFRYRGRIIRRFSPLQMEIALTLIRKNSGSFPLQYINNQIYLGDIESFFDGKYSALNIDSSEKQHFLLPTRGRSKARICLQIVYAEQDYPIADGLKSWPNLKWMDPAGGTVILYDGKLPADWDGVCGVIIA